MAKPVNKEDMLKLAATVGIAKRDIKFLEEYMNRRDSGEKIDYNSPELPLPNGRNILNFIKYHVLSRLYMSSAIDYLFDKEKFQANVSRSFDYGQEAANNRVRGITQKILDKLFLIG